MAERKRKAPADAALVKPKSETDTPSGRIDIDDSIEPETKRRQRVPASSVKDDDDEDFYDDGDDEVLPEAQPMAPRNEVDPKKSSVRESALHIYGLDFLKTGHMDEIFSQFGHKFVEWINDSSANVIFGSAAAARRALEALSFPKVGDEPWRRTPDILVSEDVPPIFLQMRLATSGDAKRPRKAMPKLGPEALAAPKGKGKGKGKGRARAPAPTGGVDAIGQPREAKKALTEEEKALRAKRAVRFADWLIKAAAEPTGEAAPAATAAGDRKPALEGVERTEEELARRKQRKERFGGDGADSSEVVDVEA